MNELWYQKHTDDQQLNAPRGAKHSRLLPKILAITALTATLLAQGQFASATTSTPTPLPPSTQDQATSQSVVSPKKYASVADFIAKQRLSHGSASANTSQLGVTKRLSKASETIAPPLDPTDPSVYNSEDPIGTNVPISASQHFGTTTANTFAIGAPQAGGTSSGKVPAGLDSFYSQKISWEKCTNYGANDYYADNPLVSCGYAIVPLDYTKPQGKTIAIGVLKSKATGTKKGSLFVNPGGPGGSGMDIVGWMAQPGSFLEYAPSLRENFDLIGWDPRGVGVSLPQINCESDLFNRAQREGIDGLSGVQLNGITKNNAELCSKRSGPNYGINGDDFIGHVGTNDGVRDLDVLRSIVGDPKLTYLGWSYGTSIGYHYSMQFPENIRAVILDGVVDPFQNNENEAKKYTDITHKSAFDPNAQAKSFQETFNQFLKTCRLNNGFGGTPCALGTGDEKSQLAQYQKLARAAWGAQTYYSDSLKEGASFYHIVNGTFYQLYSEDQWPGLNDALMALKTGGDPEAFISNATSDDDAFRSIYCNDYGTEGDDSPAASVKNVKALYASVPISDPGTNADGTPRGLDAVYSWCHYYKTKATLSQGVPLKALPNVLVVSTTYDPATPYYDGVVMAKANGMTLLTVAGNTHTSVLSDRFCANTIAESYLNTLTIPTNVTGDKNVSTKDIFSKVITGDQCQLDTSFRTHSSVSATNAELGKTVTVKAQGLARGSLYDVTVTAQNSTVVLASKMAVTADENGQISLALDTSTIVRTGDYVLTVKGAEEVSAALAAATSTLSISTKVPGILSKPTITGTLNVGKKLTAHTGEWNTKGVSFRYQWTVNGKNVEGATNSKYRVKAKDAGKRVTVIVTATSKTGQHSESARSVTVKYSSDVRVRLKVQKHSGLNDVSPLGSEVKAIIQLHSDSVLLGSKATVTVSGKTLTVSLDKNGKAVVSLPKLPIGSYTVSANFPGNSKTDVDDSNTRNLVITP